MNAPSIKKKEKWQMENQVEIQAADAASDPPGLSESKAFSFGVTLYQYQGTVWIGWTVTYPALVRVAVALYSGAQPSDPQKWVIANEVTSSWSVGAWNTGKPWGSGWSASLLGVSANSKDWIYIGVNTPVTTS